MYIEDDGIKLDMELVKSTEDAAKRYDNCEYVRIEGDTHCYDNHLDLMVSAVSEWIMNDMRGSIWQ